MIIDKLTSKHTRRARRASCRRWPGIRFRIRQHGTAKLDLRSRWPTTSWCKLLGNGASIRSRETFIPYWFKLHKYREIKGTFLVIHTFVNKYKQQFFEDCFVCTAINISSFFLTK